MAKEKRANVLFSYKLKEKFEKMRANGAAKILQRRYVTRSIARNGGTIFCLNKADNSIN